MYHLVDRPVMQLSGGSRFVLWSMRAWTDALGRGVCPPGTLATPFLAQGAIDALPSFHRLMLALNGRAGETLELAPFACRRIGEGEAILLSLWADVAREPVRARATLALIVGEEAVDRGFEALVTAEARLTAAGLTPLGLGDAAQPA